MAAGRYLVFDQTGNSAIRSDVPENPTTEPTISGSKRVEFRLYPVNQLQ